MTRRLPKVVMTIQTAMLTAMRTVRIIPKGAGQQAGPQSCTVTPSPGLLEVELELAQSPTRLEFQVAATQSGAGRVLETVVMASTASTDLVTSVVAVAAVVSSRVRQISW